MSRTHPRPVSRLDRRGLAALAGMTAANAMAQPPGITDLGVLPGGSFSYANGVSADGSTVAGTSDLAGHERAFRWTRRLGMVDLGVRPGTLYSRGLAISGDGSAVAGASGGFPCEDPEVGCGGPADVPVLWVVGEGIRVLGPELYTRSGIGAAAWPSGVNHDGSGVAISSYSYTDIDSLSVAYRWTAVAGLQILASDFQNYYERPWTEAASINYDGSVVAGSTLGRAFRWTEGVGIVDLGVLPGATHSCGVAISRDGSAVAGYSSSSLHHAFRWTADGGMHDLGLLSPRGSSVARAISGDGRLVVGADWYTAFLWTSALGMVDLNAYLPSVGVDLTGWVLTDARGLNSNGSVIVGNGYLKGQARGWLVTIPSPAPCYANCDNSTLAPILNVNDFICFNNLYATGSPLANCDNSTIAPIFNVNDFTCFLNKYATGCP